MPCALGLLFIPFLLATSFTEEVQLPAATVERLVDYSHGFNFTSLIPGMRYDGNITASWAVQDSALAGLEGKSILVRVLASAQNNSSVFFPQLLNPEGREAEAYLRCDVSAGACANTSVLSVPIPVFVMAKEDGANPQVTLKSEVAQADATGSKLPKSAGDFFESLKSALHFNYTDSNLSGQELAQSQPPGGDTPNLSEADNILDHLKPEGDSTDPVLFLRENPLVSIIALAIVVVITGAYLLNAKD